MSSSNISECMLMSEKRKSVCSDDRFRADARRLFESLKDQPLRDDIVEEIELGLLRCGIGLEDAKEIVRAREALGPEVARQHLVRSGRRERADDRDARSGCLLPA